MKPNHEICRVKKKKHALKKNALVICWTLKCKCNKYECREQQLQLSLLWTEKFCVNNGSISLIPSVRTLILVRIDSPTKLGGRRYRKKCMEVMSQVWTEWSKSVFICALMKQCIKVQITKTNTD
jgi:hypothetical protein